MKIPKGGLHNINQSSQANINDSWNVLATDEQNAVLIAVDKCGTKKTVGDTSNYMRLDGTEEGKEASGTFHYIYQTDFIDSESNLNGYLISFKNLNLNTKIVLDSRGFNLIEGGTTLYQYNYNGITSYNNFVLITSFGNEPVGLKGADDYSASITDLDYTQKIYVDNPKTLINILNHCNSTQLNEIKTILGIV